MIINGIRYRKDIPFPKHTDRIVAARKNKTLSKGRPLIYNVKKMKVGDSFLYGGKISNLSGHIGYFNLNTGFHFSYRETKEGIRVWRDQ